MHKLGRVFLIVLLSVGLWAALAQDRPGEVGPGEPFHAGECPLGHGPGIPVPGRDQLAHCECEKWWGDNAPARLAFADCSQYEYINHCENGHADGGKPHDPPTLVYVNIKLYRCAYCGLLFTEPEAR